jgi:hypothetical protein
MDRKQFDEWAAQHQILIPSTAEYFADADVCEVWFRKLLDRDLQDCLAASRAAADGTGERPAPEDTGAWVRLRAREIYDARTARTEVEQRRNGRLVCGLCKDTGNVAIWHPLIVRGIVEGVTTYRHSHTGEVFAVRFMSGQLAGKTRPIVCAIPCRCEIGDKFTGKQVRDGGGYRMEPVARYGTDRWHVPTLGKREPDPDAITAWVEGSTRETGRDVAEWEVF